MTPILVSLYRQSYTYDAWSNATLRQGRIWSTQSEYDSANYGSDDKRIGFGYDLAGNITSDASGFHNYDAAGRAATFESFQNWQAYPNWSNDHPDGPALETTDTFDGAGQVVKHAERVRQDWSTRSDDGYISYYMTDTSTNSYYIHSAVLGGQTIAELNQNGVKTKGYVYSGGAKIAIQNVWSGGSSIQIESTNPVTGAVTTTDVSGTSAGRQEPDPLGRDLTAPPNPVVTLNNDPIASTKMNSPMYLEYEANWTGEMESGMAQYVDTMQMIEAREAYKRWLKSEQTSNRDYNIWQSILTGNPNVGIVAGKETYWGSAAADFLEENASSISFGGKGIMMKQNPYKGTPLSKDDVNQLRSDVTNLLKDSKCANFMSALFDKLAANTGKGAASNSPMKIFASVERQGGFGRRKDAMSAEGGSTVGNGNAFININLFVSNSAFISASNGRVILHELVHVGASGRSGYSHYEMAQAAYDVGKVQGFKYLETSASGGDPGGRDSDNSDSFNRILFQACHIK